MWHWKIKIKLFVHENVEKKMNGPIMSKKLTQKRIDRNRKQSYCSSVIE